MFLSADFWPMLGDTVLLTQIKGATMTIEVGQQLPMGRLTESNEFDPENGCPSNPQSIDVNDATEGKK